MEGKVIVGSVIACCMLVAASAVAMGSRPVSFTRTAGEIVVRLNGDLFTRYRFKDEDGRPYVRPFLYPVLASDGTPVTSDQTAAGRDHGHHRSMWVGHGDVNGADHWGTARAKPGTRIQRPLGDPTVSGDSITHKLEWEGRDGEPVLRETRTLRFLSLGDGVRAIDVTSRYSAVGGARVILGDTKEAGLCAIRVAGGISSNSTITNARGAEGETACWGRPAEWCDISGTIEGKRYGVAILDHPANPRFPSRWHVRGYGLLAANVFALKAFERGSADRSGSFTIEPGVPVTFGYRVVVHEGSAAEADLDARFDSFAGQGGWGVAPIFNGVDLAGWKIPDPNPWWTVSDGVLHGNQDPEEKGHVLETERLYRDLVLDAEFKFSGEIDSGIFLRNNRKLQVQIGVSRSLKRDMTCSIYAGGYPGKAKGVESLLREGEWNRIRVIALGALFRIWLNGEKVLEYRDDTFRDPGPIGLQLHPKVPGMHVAFRNIRVRVLGE